MLTPEQKAKRLAPLKDLQVYMYATKNENGNTVSKLLLPSIMNLIGLYLLMPTMLECLSALVTFMKKEENFQFDINKLDAIDKTLKNASGMKDSEQEDIDKIYNTALANVTEMIGNNKEYLLSEAAKTGNQLAVIQLLKMDGIDVNAKDGGRTALMEAALSGCEAVVAQLLKIIGIDVNAKDKDGWTALMHAASRGPKAVVAQFLKIVGIDVNAKDNNNWTALMLAAFKGHETVVAQLLKVNGIDVNAKQKHNWTALMLAAHSGHVNVVAALLKVTGIEINAKSNDDMTALMYAASSGLKTIVYQLSLHQFLNAPFEQSQAVFQQLQNEIQSATIYITITPASLCEYFLKSIETLPTPAEKIALLEKALSKNNAFSALMTEKLLSRIQDAVNVLRTQETKPVIFSSSSAEASSSSSTNKVSCKQ